MNRFIQLLEERVVFFDGAMGTSIHELELDLEKDYLGLENCTEVLVLTRPDAIQSIHETYLAAGADAVETDTFGAMPHVLCEFDLQDRCREINIKACQLARKACDKYATEDNPRFVIGSMGPGTKLITLSNIDWPTMFDSYKEQAKGLIEGGCDLFLLETCQDILQIKCAVNAILEAMGEMGVKPALTPEDDGLPIMVQVTIENTGTMLTGTEIAAAAHALKDYPIVSLGMNCATGPEDMADHIKFLARHWPKHISILPNAGLPTLVAGQTVYPLQPKPFSETMEKFVDRFGLSIVGGCCGTTPKHIGLTRERIGQRLAEKQDKKPMAASITSLYSPVEYVQDNSLLNVGERCNASGSRKFKRLLEAEDWDEIVSLGRDQMREGSHVLDVNVDYAGRDNAKDMHEVVTRLVRQVDAPLMLDSTQPKTIEAGLQAAGGKCLINSGNLEDGEEKFAVMCHLAKQYGAGLVLGTIDEDPEEAMARTAERKISIARRMRNLAVNTYGLLEEDLMFDPLVLPISTGMDKDRRSGLETIEGVRLIATEFPKCQTTVGLSNISFGLKPAARQVLNSVFLHELSEAGLTSAIVHISKILPKTKIADEQWDAALDLVYNRWCDEGAEVELPDGSTTRDPLQIFVSLFADDAEVQSSKVVLADLPLEERLQKHIIDGEKKALDETLEEAMGKYTPLEIINDHLLAGMKVVGELFGSGQMQLPFVLQSAEVMKMAVAHLEPHMEKIAGQTKGSIVLATVRGDVHDIGKNLVDIILTNNGYTVHNIGIKQPVSAILESLKETKADAIGMSGLLVKSVNVMEENLHELNTQGVDVPVLLGGAALSKPYCEGHLRGIYEGHVYHGKDAFEGLRIMDMIAGNKEGELNAEIDARAEGRVEKDKKIEALKAKATASSGSDVPQGPAGPDGAAVVAEPPSVPTGRSASVKDDVEIPEPPFWGDRVVEGVDLKQVYPFINTSALYKTQWQFIRGDMDSKAYNDQLEHEVKPIFERYKQQMLDEDVLHPKVTYGYFPCNSDPKNPEDLIVYDPEDQDKEIERFTFPRQSRQKGLCISDFFLPAGRGRKDVLPVQCVTVGSKVSEVAAELFKANNYREYLYIHGMGVESAEALAEMWHKRIRQELGIATDDASKVTQLFTQKYRGSRFSFGYPACPDMSDQDRLWRMIDPTRIGCVLTENWQIDPEQSTSAIICHHPQAKYFNT
ncbi:MAG: methionine synthase [Phycisphaeraceae bacterium]|nr:methionine synthase [Phycisphaeraceae bacterium]